MRKHRALSELKPWKDNPRAIDKSDYSRLKRQITRLGQYKPLLVTTDGEVIGGNMRIRAYKDLGVEKVWVSEIEFKQEKGKWVVYLDDKKQKGIFPSKEQAIFEYAISDNDRAGYYVDVQLAEAISNLPELDPNLYKFDLGRLTPVKELMSRFGEDTTEDDFDETVPDDPKTKPGDVYLMGNHRLLCGDATNQEDFVTLMDGKKADMVFTDPPYNIDYGDGIHADGSQTKRKKIANDNMSDEEYADFLYQSMSNMVSITHGAFYVCMSQSNLHVLHEAFTKAGGHWQTYIAWAKESFTLTGTDYNRQFEPIMHGLTDDAVKKVKELGDDLENTPIMYGWTKHNWYGGRKQGDVWRIDRPKISKEHPTMKPLELCGKAIKNSSLHDHIVLDVFGGSGSTLIAAEQLNRTCYMMELDPGYCDVIVRRWETLTGKKAKLIREK